MLRLCVSLAITILAKPTATIGTLCPMEYKIFSYIDQVVDVYKEPVQRLPGLVRDPKDIIRTIEFYTNDKYLTGNTDELGREKPFYNVCNYRVTVAKTATDIDVKDIKFEPESLKDSVPTMIINRELFQTLKEIKFSETLNDMGKTRPKYGGVLVKKYEGNGELDIDVMEWINVDFDPNDVLKGIIIDTHWMKPSEFAAKSDVWENVTETLKAHSKANKGKPVNVEVKEIHGDFPESMFPDNDDNEETQSTYKRMCFYIGCVGKKKFLLYYEYEKEDLFKYLPWEKVGNGLGKGVVEDGFEAQWASNDAIISMKNANALQSKVLLFTDSQKVSGNALTGVDNGHIFQLEQGKTINAVNLGSNKSPELERLLEIWKDQYNRAASTYDGANTGEAPTAGTPYSQTALLNQVANSPFEYQREVWGIWLNEILNDWILPYLKKRIMKDHNLVAEYSDEELDLIDEAIASYNGKQVIIENLMKAEVTTPEEDMANKESVKENMRKMGKKREVKIPKGFLDVEGRITANITGELKNKAVVLQSLAQVAKDIQASFNPNTGTYAAMENPTLRALYSQIIEMSGIPFSSAALKAPTAPVQMQDLSAVKPQAPAPVNG